MHESTPRYADQIQGGRTQIPALEGHWIGTTGRQLIQLSVQHMAVLENQTEEIDKAVLEHIGASGLQSEHALLQTFSPER